MWRIYFDFLYKHFIIKSQSDLSAVQLWFLRTFKKIKAFISASLCFTIKSRQICLQKSNLKVWDLHIFKILAVLWLAAQNVSVGFSGLRDVLIKSLPAEPVLSNQLIPGFSLVFCRVRREHRRWKEWRVQRGREEEDHGPSRQLLVFYFSWRHRNPSPQPKHSFISVETLLKLKYKLQIIIIKKMLVCFDNVQKWSTLRLPLYSYLNHLLQLSR